MPEFTDRFYQTNCLEANIAEYDKGCRRMVNVMATGTGKTHVFGRVFDTFKSRLPNQMMVLAHTKELVHQSHDRMAELYQSKYKVGIEMATIKCDPESDIIVASVETLGREESTRASRFNWDRIDKLIVDEAHHSTGDSYRRVFEHAGVFAPDTDKLFLGFTATPNRPDGEGLGQIFEKVAFVYSIRDAIKDGWLVPPKGWRVKTSLDLAGVGVRNGDFIKSELSTAVDTPTRNEEIVKAWELHGKGRQTVVFCVDIQHAQDVAAAFQKAGYPAEAVWGDDPNRDAKIQAHKIGELQILCNCQVLTEGYDDPAISCIVVARPTLSSISYQQMIGRGLRLFLGKIDCIVIDVVDSSLRNSLMTLPTLLGIITPMDLEGRSVIQVVEELELVQEQYPTIDLLKLDSMGQLKVIISQVDLFEIRFPTEVEQNSEFTWFRAADGGYKMLLAGAGWVRIFPNVLGKWEIVADVNDEPLHGTRNSLEEAFRGADEAIRKRVSTKVLACIKREGTWQNKPLSKYPKLITMLKRLFKKDFPVEHMTAGQASKLINERLTKLKLSK